MSAVPGNRSPGRAGRPSSTTVTCRSTEASNGVRERPRERAQDEREQHGQIRDPGLGAHRPLPLGAADEPDSESRCRDLATSPESPYVRVLVAQHHRDGQEFALRSRVVRAAGTERTIASLEEFTEVLGRFRIPVSDLGAGAVETIWERTGSQHAAWLELQARAAR